MAITLARMRVSRTRSLLKWADWDLCIGSHNIPQVIHVLAMKPHGSAFLQHGLLWPTPPIEWYGLLERRKTYTPKLWLMDHTCYGLSELLEELVEQTTLELFLDLVVVEPLK